MLYCQPNSFYDEMMYVSENNERFLKKLALTEYKIPDTVLNLEPIGYLIKIVLTEPDFYGNDKIIALRTFGVNDSLTMTPNCTYMSVYYAMIAEGSLLISKPTTSYVYMNDEGETIYKTSDEYGDEYHYRIEDIAKSKSNDIYALDAYVYYSSRLFRPDNIMAKIPTFLLKNMA
ncbi:hypothetical protein pEaSNUABM50_00105 [Erwinia phage pEa_SNUABM_50]|uniref:Uncharacterized protein n=4 Tax=Eneladusvirus BF TaxID=2560751 RepID=A0A7L8ZN67_9CAUD|nr:hypothetical protein FDH34_gp107 [Serratia phage BF]QOI71045.1 hypothetical protein pEaSNUABM12_00107 [Erwinia phage pEa_SNUABM_12]QOI71590.1 hypothetical protein pEaSNUABM47_00106 [Erwinia phage pEa_SNUABM_47]QOI72129.1 hypothetical protein pEaSNUABM50_00105 [Erwinia phage pEa_SNUABM_50]QXO11254.1 hypothetical protein pEaSNUABM19_00108 [Erwinia phage pEa_SNUABM_19]QXO11802.1 hypothetical protein pEaSNUABM44_00106 [Erwinia phage pEa_SNUABM_44]QXO12354.1 hypothetical protein pEaSNUABM49_001